MGHAACSLTLLVCNPIAPSWPKFNLLKIQELLPKLNLVKHVDYGFGDSVFFLVFFFFFFFFFGGGAQFYIDQRLNQGIKHLINSLAFLKGDIFDVWISPFHTDGLEHDSSISIANTLEILQSCTDSSIYFIIPQRFMLQWSHSLCDRHHIDCWGSPQRWIRGFWTGRRGRKVHLPRALWTWRGWWHNQWPGTAET